MEAAKVHISPLLPYRKSDIQLSRDVLVTDQFRIDFNTWLNERFGKDVHAVLVYDEYHVSMEAYLALKNKEAVAIGFLNEQAE